MKNFSYDTTKYLEDLEKEKENEEKKKLMNKGKDTSDVGENDKNQKNNYDPNWADVF